MDTANGADDTWRVLESFRAEWCLSRMGDGGADDFSQLCPASGSDIQLNVCGAHAGDSGGGSRDSHFEFTFLRRSNTPNRRPSCCQ